MFIEYHLVSAGRSRLCSKRPRSPPSQIIPDVTAIEPGKIFNIILLQENHIITADETRTLCMFCLTHVNNVPIFYDIQCIVSGGITDVVKTLRVA